MKLCYLLVFSLALPLSSLSIWRKSSIDSDTTNKHLHQIILYPDNMSNEKLYREIVKCIGLGADLSKSVNGTTMAQKLGDCELSKILKSNEKFNEAGEERFCASWDRFKDGVFEARMKASGINF